MRSIDALNRCAQSMRSIDALNERAPAVAVALKYALHADESTTITRVFLSCSGLPSQCRLPVSALSFFALV
jgi:hypothetical protein